MKKTFKSESWRNILYLMFLQSKLHTQFMLYADKTFPFTLPPCFRLSSSFFKVSSTLDSALLTVPTQSSGWTPISIHSLEGGGDLREGNLYQRETQEI